MKDLSRYRSVIGPSKVYLEDSVETGTKRILRASILERFPVVDRHDISLPEELVDFFFNNYEKVITKEQLRALTPEERENGFKQAVCTGADGKVSYITCHMFYEDLAKVAEVLPKRKGPLECFKEVKHQHLDQPPSPKFGQQTEAKP